MSTPLTTAQLARIFPAAAPDYLDRVVAELNTDLATYGLDTRLRQAHFFAQVRQECGAELAPVDENLNYSPEALKKFSYYQRHPAEALTDGYDRDPATRKILRRAAVETIANKVYGGRAELGNGDIASGDGWRFRGRGFIQVTGRANYAAVTRQCQLLYPGVDVDFVNHPDMMGATPGAERSAVGYWIMNGLHKLADRGATAADVDRITAVINKNTDSYAARRANFTIAFDALA
jgi:putative chitinase